MKGKFTIARYAQPFGISILLALSSNTFAGEKVSYAAFYRSLQSTQAKNWDIQKLEQPLANKIQPLDKLAGEFNKSFNERDGFKLVPKPAELDQATKKAVVEQLNLLPIPLKKFFDRHIIGIFTATDVGGTAMAGSVYQSFNDAKARFGFIILDIAMIDRPLNEWATFKENTVFSPRKNLQLTLTMADKGANTKAATIRYLLTHEIGHIFHAVTGLQPPYHALTWQDSDFKTYPFNQAELTLKAQRGEDYYPLYDAISFYRPTQPFDLDDAGDVYSWLLSTSHPSLYAATNELEDFAETFALLIHVKYLNQPYRLELKTGAGKTVVGFSNRLNHPLIQPKVSLIESYLTKMAAH